MLPLPQLKALAQSLMRTPEYTEMMQHRKKVMENAALGRQMLAFEREHARLMNLNLPAADTSARLKQLFQNYRGFLENKDVQSFMAATHRYQRMISDCVAQLNRFLDINSGIGRY